MKKRKAVTLIEVLIVISVITMFSGLAFVGIRQIEKSVSSIAPNITTVNLMLQSAKAAAIKNQSYAALQIEPNGVGQSMTILVSDVSLGYPNTTIDPDQVSIPFRPAIGFQPLRFKSPTFILHDDIKQIYTIDKRLFFVFNKQGHLVRNWVYLPIQQIAYFSSISFVICDLRNLQAAPDPIAFIDSLSMHTVNRYTGKIVRQ